MQNQVAIVILVIALAAPFLVLKVNARCGVCNDHRFACVNETAFQMCFSDDTPDSSQTFTCLDNEVCTDLGLICVDRDAAETGDLVACSPNDDTTCGQCSANSMFTCTSRTTFQQCNGTTPIQGQTGSCPTGFSCVSGTELCVEDCDLPDTLQCNN